MTADVLRNRLLLLMLAAGLLAMLGASLWTRFSNPSLTVSNFRNIAQQEPALADQGAMDSVGQLMRNVAQNPQDRAQILRLVESLMSMGQWDTAENFAQKALSLDSPEQPNERALYLLALIHHNKGQHGQAAELLEKLLEKSENPSARYSVAILYLHFLNDPKAGLNHLEKGLASGLASPALARAMSEELEKFKKNNERASGD